MFWYAIPVGGGHLRTWRVILSAEGNSVRTHQHFPSNTQPFHPPETRAPSRGENTLPPRKHPPATYKPELQHASPQVQTNEENPCLVIEEKTLWTMPVTM